MFIFMHLSAISRFSYQLHLILCKTFSTLWPTKIPVSASALGFCDALARHSYTDDTTKRYQQTNGAQLRPCGAW